MTEEFLYYIWKNKLFDKINYSYNNKKIEIIDVGEQNFDSGPDFFNAKIKIDNTIWAGNIEIHKNASDWFKHKHNNDKSYNNVILHVVDNFDKEITNKNNIKIPTIELKFNKKYLENFKYLITSRINIKCINRINFIDEFTINFWLDKLLIERLEEKSKTVDNILQKNKNNWDETFYKLLAVNFGLKTNALPFELLASSLPLNIIYKHKNSLFQLEALLFGQAGFLEQNIKNDKYFNNLKTEYKYLKKKYKLNNLNNYIWKFNKLRPNNFPTIRIAQFAALINNSSKLFSVILEINNTKELFNLFKFTASKYWDNHYKFGIKSLKKTKKQTGKSFIDNIIINTISIIIFTYAKNHSDQEKKDFAIELIEKIKPEKNNIITKWNETKININNATKTQSLIQLYNNYCKKNNCINCEIGNKIITLH